MQICYLSANNANNANIKIRSKDGALLARISHQAASDTDKTLVIKREIEMIKNTACYSSVPITVQAGLRVRKLALYGYAFRSRAALSNTNPAPAPVILV